MKKIFKSLAALALIAFAASCSKEQAIEAIPSGEEALVSFTVSTPALQTKAIADGNTVDKVSCNVYDAEGVLISNSEISKTIAISGGKVTFSVRLVTGQTYSFIFWAYNEAGAHYTLDAANKKVTVSYTDATSNDESRDAFYAYVAPLQVTGAINKTVTLSRPFAQVNFGVTKADITAAKNAGIEVAKSSVKLTALATELNLVDGTVSGNEDAEFSLAALPEEDLTVGTTDYGYVAMNYALVGKDAKSLSDATLNIYDSADAVINTVSVPNIPLQGNYRTNILGNLFTSAADFNLVVDPAFEEPDNSIIPVVSQVDLDAAFTSAAAAGADLILSVSGEVTLPDYSTSVTYPSKIVINGTDGAVVKIDHRCVATDCEIEFNNVTVKNAIGNVYVNGGTNDDSWPQLKDAKNLTFTDCTIEEQLRIVVKGTATFTNCTFTNQTKSGYDGYCLNYYNYTGSKVVVENCNFTAPEKGILIWGDKGTEYDLTVNNCTFTATVYPSTGGNNDKGAVQINSESPISGTVRINKCTATGFNTTSDANGLWFEVDNQPWQNEHYGQPNSHFNIYVDGVQVQTSDMQ